MEYLSESEDSSRRPEDERAASGSAADRQQIIGSLISLVAERGNSHTTLEALCLRSGLQRSGFEQHFDSLETCLTAAWEEVTQEFAMSTGAAYAAAGNWRDGIRAAAWACCRIVQENHDKARFSVELSLTSEPMQASRDFIMDGWAELVHLGRFERPQAADVPRAQAQAVVGAIWERLVKTITEDGFERLPNLVPEAMYITVLPYLGEEAAQEELRRGPVDLARHQHGVL